MYIKSITNIILLSQYFNATLASRLSNAGCKRDCHGDQHL